MNIEKMLSRVETELKKRGISKMFFYDSCGITPSAYSQWKTGSTYPSRKKLLAIASFFDWTEDELMNGIKKDPPTYGGLSDREKALIDVFRLIPAENQDNVLELAKSALNLLSARENKSDKS